MTQNIEQRTLAATNTMESAAKSVDEIAHQDKVVETPVGPRKSIPRLARELEEDNVRRENDFQQRFSQSQYALDWSSGIEVTDQFQRYKVGIEGQEGYKEYLPNPEKIPFTTNATLLEDLSNGFWLENGVPSKHWTEREIEGKTWHAWPTYDPSKPNKNIAVPYRLYAFGVGAERVVLYTTSDNVVMGEEPDYNVFESVNDELRSDILSGKVYAGKNGIIVKNGDKVPENTTHLRVSVSGKPTLVLMDTPRSGVVSNLTESGADIGFFKVSFFKEIIVPSIVSVFGGESLESFTERAYVVRTVTVGDSGDYLTVNDAIFANARLKPPVNKVRNLVEVKLLTGFVFSEQLIIYNTDLSHIVITSEDPIVKISRAALNDPSLSYLAKSNFPAFGIMENSTGPTIDVLFDMDDTGEQLNRTGVLVNQNSFIAISPGKGVNNAGYRGLHISNSRAMANGANFDGAADIALRAGNMSEVWGDSFSGRHCGNVGVSIDSLCRSYLRGAKFDFGHNACVNLAPMSFVDFSNGSACDGGYGIKNAGGHIVFEGADIQRNTHGNVKFSDGATGGGKLSNTSGCVNGDNVLLANASNLDAHGMTSIDAGANAINCQSASNCDADNSVLTGSTLSAVFCVQTGKVNARGADCSNSKGVSDVRVLEGGIVAFKDGIGQTNIPANTVSNNGIIFT